MKITDKTHISLSAEDVKDLLIKQLYHSQGISGIFDVKFKIAKRQDCDRLSEFDGAEIIVDLNEK
jgi:hypothetical protein